MPEGDTIYRVAEALRPYLVGQPVLAARGGRAGPQLDRLVGSNVVSVEPMGKHMITTFSNGLALHTHLRMTGSWHRYRPGEPWRRPAVQASVVLEVPRSVVVCFNAPVVELVLLRNVPAIPALASLGPDLLAPAFSVSSVRARMRTVREPRTSIADALLDQRVVAGVGNVYKSEILFIERLNPWAPLESLSDDVLDRVLETSARLLRANVGPASGGRTTTSGRGVGRESRLWVYGRTGRPCLRCSARIESRLQGQDARRTYWCPVCQPPSGGAPG